MKSFALALCTPTELVLSQQARSVRAEDESGWFGIAPGRRALLALLVPGLWVYRDERGEGFVALDGGLLFFDGRACHVTSHDAVHARRIEELTAHLRTHRAQRRSSHARQRDVLDDLVQEALGRLLREVR